MAPEKIDPLADIDITSTFTSVTPPESAISIPEDQVTVPKPRTLETSIPWPGSTFILRCTHNNQVLALRDGHVILAPLGAQRSDSIYWRCVEKDGWLGFVNPASGRYLGHNQKGELVCEVQKFAPFERFCVRMKGEEPGAGGFVLLLTHHDKLWPVGIKDGDGEIMAKVGTLPGDGLVWEFIKT